MDDDFGDDARIIDTDCKSEYFISFKIFKDSAHSTWTWLRGIRNGVLNRQSHKSAHLKLFASERFTLTNTY